jgi:hypothetical protein
MRTKQLVIRSSRLLTWRTARKKDTTCFGIDRSFNCSITLSSRTRTSTHRHGRSTHERSIKLWLVFENKAAKDVENLCRKEWERERDHWERKLFIRFIDFDGRKHSKNCSVFVRLNSEGKASQPTGGHTRDSQKRKNPIQENRVRSNPKRSTVFWENCVMKNRTNNLEKQTRTQHLIEEEREKRIWKKACDDKSI